MFKFSVIGSLIILIVITFFSCSEDSSFDVGNSVIDPQSNVIVLDTFTIHTYTVKADSILTTGFKRSLIGRYTDGNLGTITSSSCLQFTLPRKLTDNELLDKEHMFFDSICLVVKPSGYIYGDSSKAVHMNLYKLTNNPYDDAKDRYNVYKVYYDKNELYGTRNTVLRPNEGENFTVRLPDSFGEELFDKMKDYANNDEVKTQQNFLEYFPGLAVVPDENQESPIFSFKTDTANCHVKLYYHLHSEKYEISMAELLNGSDIWQYNHIVADYGISPLNTLLTQEDKVSSTVTGNQTYCQAGTGVMTRIEFPYLQSLFKDSKVHQILSAQLIIRAVHGTFDKFDPADSLYLYKSDKLNTLGSIISNAKGEAIKATVVRDYSTNDYVYYYDISYYFTNQMAALTDEAPALLLTRPVSDSGYRLDRILLGDFYNLDNPMRLKVTYWQY